LFYKLVGERGKDASASSSFSRGGRKKLDRRISTIAGKEGRRKKETIYEQLDRPAQQEALKKKKKKKRKLETILFFLYYREKKTKRMTARRSSRRDHRKEEGTAANFSQPKDFTLIGKTDEARIGSTATGETSNLAVIEEERYIFLSHKEKKKNGSFICILGMGRGERSVF